ncbi:MAG: Crp/Fnr family transcriptional regulator [Burkholderiaceae bacterium]
MVVVGQVKLFVVSPGGNEKVVELCGPGHSFAEAVMFMGVPYVVSSQALADSLILTVSKEAVFHEIEADRRFALRMLAGLSRRLHGLIKDVEAYTLHSGVQRVIGYLLSTSTRSAPATAPLQNPPPSPCLPARPPSPALCRSRLNTSRACCTSWNRPV